MTRPFTTDMHAPRPAIAAPLVGATDDDGAAVLVGWGDAVLPATPSLPITELDPQLQARQCGFDTTVLALLPLRGKGRTLLVLGHATAGLPAASAAVSHLPYQQRMQLLVAAQGVSVIELEQTGSARAWRMCRPRNHGYNRRLNNASPAIYTGPAVDLAPTGSGMYAPSGGTATAWGTVLVAENAAGAVCRGLKTHDRLHCGWIVELDPYDPHSIARKHTALGRARHAGVLARTTAAGHPVVYLRERSGLLLRFTSRRRASRGIGATDRARNADLLHEGTLAAARLDSLPTRRTHGRGTWLPLVSGAKSHVDGMSSAQALADTAQSARAVGATAITSAVQLPAAGLRHIPFGAELQEQAVELDDSDATSFI